jgi:hypothetical protein
MKIINFNPHFITWNYGYKFIIDFAFNLHLIIFIELIFIFFLLYYFNYQEIFFLYNMFFNNKLSINDVNKLNQYEDIINDILKSELYCSEDDNLYIRYKNNNIKAMALNNDEITDCDKLLNNINS